MAKDRAPEKILKDERTIADKIIEDTRKKISDPKFAEEMALLHLMRKAKNRGNPRQAGALIVSDKGMKTTPGTTKGKKKQDPMLAAKGGMIKGYMGGGSVHKNKKNMITTKGWGASRKT